MPGTPRTPEDPTARLAPAPGCTPTGIAARPEKRHANALPRRGRGSVV